MSEPRGTHARSKIADAGPSLPCLLFKYNIVFCFFVFLFVVMKPENLYFAFRPGLEVNTLGVHILGPRKSSCSPTKGTPLPRNTLRAN